MRYTTPVMTQNHSGNKGKKRDHWDIVYFQNYFITYFPVKALPFINSHLIYRLFLRLQIRFHNNRLADIHVNAAKPFAQYFTGFDYLRGIFRSFGRSRQFFKIWLLFNHAVIADVNRNSGKIFTIFFLIGLNNHGKKSVLGHDHLARSTSSAFNKKFQRQSFF